MIVLIIGAPASGKGTQAEKMEKELGLKHMASGDLFRKSTDKEVINCMELGKLLPDELVTKVFLNEIEGKDDLILDGYPRNLAQAKTIDEFLAETGKKIDYVIYLNATERKVIERISNRRVCPKCGNSYNLITKPPDVEGKCSCGADLIQRNDDKEEVIRARLEVFREQTEPILEHYRDRVIEINGDNEIGVVFEEICKALNQ